MEKEAAFRAMLVKLRVNSASRWSKTKDLLAKESAYQAVLPKEDREKFFRIFVAELKVRPRLTCNHSSLAVMTCSNC